ncbi:MAG: hypothetical protein QOG39_600 [Acidimicrobiaceae bacterium]
METLVFVLAGAIILTGAIGVDLDGLGGPHPVAELA